ncbi:tight adherence protein B [Nocardioides thalensis]|uniref:Tight adherence protein B n=1 Tax=Nocardioides thalensis TaxID=1914755 RepID=A0A853BVR2_9ACTN|nr:type II secretion system protein [Nocardioides thalensis]NYI99368.1 tight adherence protein B [Nocardioides thalensis]
MTSAAVAAALMATAASLLLVPRGGLGKERQRRRPAAPYALAVAAVAAGVVVADEPRVAVLVVIVGAAGLTGARLVARHREDRRAAVVRSRVVELCATLHAELAAGQGPGPALARAAADWPLLAPVVRTAATSGDVPAALRDLTSVPGAGDLRVVAAAWQVAHRTGHGLGDAVARVAEELRGAEQTRRVVTGELASARATARLVAGLPVVALLMGSGAGADPWAFLVGHPLGLACLGGGLGFVLAGLTWIEALARDVERGR